MDHEWTRISTNSVRRKGVKAQRPLRQNRPIDRLLILRCFGKRQEEAQKAAEQAAFDADKQSALKSLKGMASDDLKLKSFGSGSSSGLKLKGLDASPTFGQLKSADQPFVITDAMVVDARNVPTGLPKNVEDSIPPTPAGDRVRKGFQAVLTVDWKQHDWKVALAWFQDALNHDPGNAGIKRLVDFAQFTLNRRIQEHNLPFENNSAPVQQLAATPAKEYQMPREWQAAADVYYEVIIKPSLQALEKREDEKLLLDMQLNPPAKTSIQPQKAGDPAWSKFTQWLNENFAPKKVKEPQAVGAARD